MTITLSSLLLRSLLLALLGLGLALALRRRSAALRHVVCVGTLAALLVLPALVLWLPSARVRVPVAVPSRFITGADAPAPQEADAPVESSPTPTAPGREASVDLSLVGKLVWLLGAAVLLLRMGVGLARARRWVRRGTPLSDPLPDFPKGVQVLLSEEARVPMTLWLGRHFVLLPREAEGWEASRLRSALLHEAAHVRRGDWFSLMLGLLCRALYWPNPLVWLLVRESLVAAETAADDRVLAAGVASSTYAQDLLRIAQGLRGRDPLPALPMARKPEVRRRIEEVLNEKKNRGAVGMATLVLCAAGAAAVAIPGAMVALKFKEVGPGPGNPGNDYLARLPDGREVELVQISRPVPGGVQSWRPDGTPISPQDAIPMKKWTGDADGLEFLYRFPSKVRDDSISAGMGSGPYVEGGPREMTFSGNAVLPADGSGKRTLISYMKIPQVGNGKQSFGFSLSDEPFEVPLVVHFGSKGAMRFVGKSGHAAIGDDGSMDIDPFKNVKVVYPAKQEPVLRYSNGEILRDWRRSNVKLVSGATALELVVRPGHEQKEVRAVAFDRRGRGVKMLTNEGWGDQDGLHQRWFFKQKPQELGRIEVRMRPYQITEFHEVRLRPNGASNP